MADRTSAAVFRDLFTWLAEQEPTEERRRVALKLWTVTETHDFMYEDLGCDEALSALGLARMTEVGNSERMVEYGIRLERTGIDYYRSRVKSRVEKRFAVLELRIGVLEGLLSESMRKAQGPVCNFPGCVHPVVITIKVLDQFGTRQQLCGAHAVDFGYWLPEDGSPNTLLHKGLPFPAGSGVSVSKDSEGRFTVLVETSPPVSAIPTHLEVLIPGARVLSASEASAVSEAFAFSSARCTAKGCLRKVGWRTECDADGVFLAYCDKHAADKGTLISLARG